jgi:NAD(P)-dependent dehydrogenase (short-subunit alcohol dehydrogenase family)
MPINSRSKTRDLLGYEGKVCVITGASSGMGKATADLLLELGADVYALSRTDPGLPGMKQWIATDLGDRDSIDQAFAQVPKRFDCFFGVAGVSGVEHSYDETFTINFVSAKYLTDTYLINQVSDGGAIAFMSSSSGARWARPDLVAEYQKIVDADGWDATVSAVKDLGQSDSMGAMAYMLAKRALNYFAAAKAAQFAERDIRVNFCMPCSTLTPFVSNFLSVTGRDVGMFRASIGNGKDFARSEAMAKAIVYLNSDFAEYVSGYGLMVDYGLEAAVATGQTQDLFGMNLV